MTDLAANACFDALSVLNNVQLVENGKYDSCFLGVLSSAGDKRLLTREFRCSVRYGQKCPEQYCQNGLFFFVI